MVNELFSNKKKKITKKNALEHDILYIFNKFATLNIVIMIACDIITR